MNIIQENQILPEILVMDKPFGISSFDVIRIIQKHFGKIKIGHAGTLDPRATGVLVLGIGKGTKKLADLVGLDKVYIADILLGKKTTTGDLEGEILEEQKDISYSKKEIEEKVLSLEGIQTLPVSVFSALKKDGKPLYQYAREGKDIESPVREMKVYQANLLDIFEQEGFVYVRVRFFVSKGTYIRSLAEELGIRLGFPATLASLRRMKVGEFAIEKAYSLPRIWIQDFKERKKAFKNKDI
jgi:tRNA pseudouridine55 synthase